jgi:hypothetical protein
MIFYELNQAHRCREKEEKKKPEILKFRTKIWYQSIRYLAEKMDGELSCYFGIKV